VQNSVYYNEKRRSFEPVLFARKKVGLEVITEETSSTCSCFVNSLGQNYHRKIGDKLFKIVAEFKYLGTYTNKANLHA
jgi:hypothetical protein